MKSDKLKNINIKVRVKQLDEYNSNRYVMISRTHNYIVLSKAQ